MITQRSVRIKEMLSVLTPQYLKITDESYLHVGHMPTETQETHMQITIAALSLRNKSMVDKHKIINNLLRTEFDKGLHALSIVILNRNE